jgi:hypothetical protein
VNGGICIFRRCLISIVKAQAREEDQTKDAYFTAKADHEKFRSQVSQMPGTSFEKFLKKRT